MTTIMIDSIIAIAIAGPLLGSIITAVLGPRFLRDRSHIPAIAGVSVAFVASLLLAGYLCFGLAGGDTAPRSPESADLDFGISSDFAMGIERIVTLWTWAHVDQAYRAPSLPSVASPIDRPFAIAVSLRIDPLTVFMLVTVTSVSLLVVIYSIGYMAGDPGYWRFFTYMCLFVFSMMMLVSVSNFLLLYIFWEAVGLCSYLLIGFWYTRPAAAAAGKKAFLVNRVGDFGFALGVFLLWTAYGTLDMHDTHLVPGILGETRIAAGPSGFVGGTLGLGICMLLFLGACGKSAQFPLHVWLPDAMEGPTPVSALIHAATMVTAGVYLVARCAPLFHAVPEAQVVVCLIGTVTALLAAFIALSQTDVKRILAYSTISQLGYMFAAAGLSTVTAVAAAMFHLFTHAFFKALLFLSAGSLMHALSGEIDLRQFGGLRRKLPLTHLMFLVGGLALAGVAPLAGFWSKDAILHEIAEQENRLPMASLVFWGLVLGAGLTAFYIFRAYFLAFWGPERLPESSGGYVHESPPVMLVPMLLLALGAVGAGWVSFLPGGVSGLLQLTPSLVAVGGEQAAEPAHLEHLSFGPKHLHELAHHIPVISTAVAVGGILLAAIIYLPYGRPLLTVVWTLTRGIGLYALSYGKLFIDEVYEGAIVRPLRALASLCSTLDQRVIDLRAVDGTAQAIRTAGQALRTLGHGMLPGYALAMLTIVVLLLAFMML